MRCPNCSLINADSALRCDCGYDFAAKQMKESFAQSPIFLRYGDVLEKQAIPSNAQSSWADLKPWLLASVLGSIVTLVAGIPLGWAGMNVMETTLRLLNAPPIMRPGELGPVLCIGPLGVGIACLEWLVLGRRIFKAPLWIKVGSLGVTAIGYTVEGVVVIFGFLAYLFSSVSPGGPVAVLLRVIVAFAVGLVCTRLPLLWLFFFFNDSKR